MVRKLLKASLVSAVVLPQALAGTRFDPPDLNLELELHRQYLMSRGVGTASLGVREGLTQSYKIQPGETLWSLSELLYGDGNYWPRVWAQNKNIANPHLIRPGHMLQFMMGSEDDTPAFRFTEEDDQGLELVAASGGGNPVIEIPPPEVPPKPVLRVPPSFPEWQSVYRTNVDKLEVDDRSLGPQIMKMTDKIFLRAYVQEQDLNPAGSFLEADQEATLPVVNQYIFVKIKKGTGRPGQKILIVRDAGLVKAVSDVWENNVGAHMVQIAAEAELTESVKHEFHRSRDRENFEAFRALVTKTTGLSTKAHDLIMGEMPIVDVTSNGRSGSVTATIFGSEKHERSAIYSQGELVFLDKGSRDGLEPGHILDIYVNRLARNMHTSVPESPSPSGQLKVLRVTAGLATAVILRAKDSIQQGDRAMAPGSGSPAGGTSMSDASDVGDDDDIDFGGGEDQPDGGESEQIEDEIEDEI